MKPRVLNFKVALCVCMIFMCSSLSQSINMNSKQAAHNNKKLQNPNGLAPLPDIDVTNEEDEDDDDKGDYFSSNEFDHGSSGANFLGNPDAEDLDKFQNNALPFFLHEPENEYIVKSRPAILKCKTTHALDVCFLLFLHFLLIDTL